MKLTYTTHEQLIEDATKAMLEAHLNWSNSLGGKPSDDNDCVKSAVLYAYIDAHFTPEEWCNEVGDRSKKLITEKCNRMAEAAANEADRKWEEAKTLLGL